MLSLFRIFLKRCGSCTRTRCSTPQLVAFTWVPSYLTHVDEVVCKGLRNFQDHKCAYIILVQIYEIYTFVIPSAEATEYRNASMLGGRFCSERSPKVIAPSCLIFCSLPIKSPVFFLMAFLKMSTPDKGAHHDQLLICYLVRFYSHCEESRKLLMEFGLSKISSFQRVNYLHKVIFCVLGNRNSLGGH